MGFFFTSLIYLFGIFQLFSVAGYECLIPLEYIAPKDIATSRTRPTYVEMEMSCISWSKYNVYAPFSTPYIQL